MAGLLLEASLRWSAPRFWILTVANGLVLFGLLPLTIFGMMLAMAAMAPEIEAWPILTIACVGAALTSLGIYFTKGAQTLPQRWSGYVVHGGSIAIYILLTVIWVSSWARTTRRMFVLPVGFKGDLYVLHNLSGQKSTTGHWRTTYLVPPDGILVTGDPMPQSMNDEYAYQLPDDRTTRITDLELTTIPDNPANRQDREHPIVFFPRTGSTTVRSGCTVQFEQVYVGTKADLLTNYKGSDLESYIEQHPRLCATK